MKIKKFQAKSFAEALTLVKKELSEDAIILSSEERKGLRPYVEVTAAVDYAVNHDVTGNRKKESNLKMKSASVKNRRPASGPKETKRPEFQRYITRMTGDIKREIAYLRDNIEDMRNSGYEMSLPPKKKMIMHFLRERSIRDEFSMLLCERAGDIDEIPSLIESDIRIRGRERSRRVIMLIGPTGVGKTTTLAKLAAQAIKKGKRAAIINLDNYRIGSIEQVRIYSRILGIPLSNATNVKELRSSVLRFGEEKDVIFIDTTGRNPRDRGYIDYLFNICSSGIPLELHLLCSATSDDEYMIDMYRAYKRLPVNYLGFTKVDEAVRFGSLYNLLLTYQKPVAYVTNGQTVPDDIEFARVDRIANLILKKECYQC